MAASVVYALLTRGQEEEEELHSHKPREGATVVKKGEATLLLCDTMLLLSQYSVVNILQRAQSNTLVLYEVLYTHRCNVGHPHENEKALQNRPNIFF